MDGMPELCRACLRPMLRNAAAAPRAYRMHRKKRSSQWLWENKIKLQSCRRRFGWWLLVAVGALTTVYGFAQESEKNPGVTTSLHRESVKPQADKDAEKFKTREGRLQAEDALETGMRRLGRPRHGRK